MKINTPVGISNHHIHLTEATYIKLFGNNQIIVFKNLKQPGLFAAIQTLKIKTNKGVIENVRVVGPFRTYDQVEISSSDAYQLGLKPPVRKSGDVTEAAEGTIIGPAGEVTTNNIIIAQRHVHISQTMASEKGISNDQKVKGIINTAKPGMIELRTVISPEAYYEIHLDLDDANAFLLTAEDEIIIDYEI
ncbi:MAG TPA: PduL/EutD family phosphate acyltransferase [Bacilli bacterium]|nr:PduL/EutD family phosphate acyltransferase [Bacilli bacterium]